MRLDEQSTHTHNHRGQQQQQHHVVHPTTVACGASNGRLDQWRLEAVTFAKRCREAKQSAGRRFAEQLDQKLRQHRSSFISTEKKRQTVSTDAVQNDDQVNYISAEEEEEGAAKSEELIQATVTGELSEDASVQNQRSEDWITSELEAPTYDEDPNPSPLETNQSLDAPSEDRMGPAQQTQQTIQKLQQKSLATNGIGVDILRTSAVMETVRPIAGGIGLLPNRRRRLCQNPHPQ